MQNFDYLSEDKLIDFGLSYTSARKFIEAIKKEPFEKRWIEVLSKQEIELLFYYVMIDGEPDGPFSIFELVRLVNKNIINKDTLIWRPQLSGWVKAEYFGSLITGVAVLPPPVEKEK
jgi:hypothetical protein